MTTHSIVPAAASELDIAASLRAVSRTLLTLACLALVVVAVVTVRYAAYEYAHGNKSTVVRLIDAVKGDRP